MYDKYREAFFFVWDILKKYKMRIVIILFSSILSSWFSLLIPYLSKIETDQLVEQKNGLFFLNDNPFMIFVYIVIVLFVVQMIDNIIQTIFNWLQTKYRESFSDDLFLAMYKRLQFLELGIYSNKRNQDLFSKILWNKEFVWNLLSSVMVYINMTIFLIWSIAILSQVDKKVGIALLIWWISYYIFYYFERKIDVYGRFQTWELERSLREIEWITRSEFHRLAYAGGTKLIEDTISDFNTSRRNIIYENNRKRETLEIVKNIVTKVIENWIKVIVWMSIFSGAASVWSLILTLWLLQKLSSFIASVVWSQRQFEDARESFDILNLYLDATKQKDQVELIQTIKYDSIILNNLTFSYPSFTGYELQYFDIMLKRLDESQEKLNEFQLNKLHALQDAKNQKDYKESLVLDNVAMEFIKGNVYGIVGRNGAGKSTMMHLIMNFFNLPNNTILWWKTGNEKLWFRFFEKNIAVIEQDPFMLRWFTLKQNLLLWVSKNYTDDQLYDLLHMFDLDTKIRKLRNGLDTLYSYDCDLSGWQQQIIALLRVYLQDKPVMILDEGTNQLDATNEIKIMNLLLQKKKNKIVIMISHRMTTLNKADYLFCLEDGKITDQWTPTELRKKESLFKRFWNEQVE